MSFFRHVSAAYQSRLIRRPLLTQSATAAALYAAGDAVAQNVGSPGEKFEWYRTVTMTAIGGCALGPAMAIWYRYLQTRIQLPSKVVSTFARVTADQVIFAPASIVGLFTLVQLCKPTSDTLTTRLNLARDHVHATFVDVLVQNYKVWPAVQTVNFFFVPLQYRLLVSNAVAMFWSAYLSMNANKVAREDSTVTVQSM